MAKAKEKKKPVSALVESWVRTEEEAAEMIRQRSKHYTGQKVDHVFSLTPAKEARPDGSRLLSCYQKEGATTKNRINQDHMQAILNPDATKEVAKKIEKEVGEEGGQDETKEEAKS